MDYCPLRTNASLSRRIFQHSLTRYLVTSAGSSIALITGSAALNELGLTPTSAYACALGSVFLANFQLARYWVFSDTDPEAQPMRRLIHVAAVSGVSRSLEFTAFLALQTLTEWYFLINVILIHGVSLVLKHLYLRHRVFVTREPRSPEPTRGAVADKHETAASDVGRRVS